jgi:EmrB/QacA subfamily drug resistance transporter
MTNIEQKRGHRQVQAGGGDPRRWLALGVLCLSLVLITLDNTVLNVALPTLVRDLHASSSQLQWIVDGYQLVFAGLLFTAGSMADRHGRKGTLQIGLVLFGAGTLASAFAGSASMLIITRSFMGIGGAMIMPATLSILSTLFPDPSERTRAIAIWAAMASVGIALGPVIGGVLLAHFGWGSIFLINVPVVAVALLGGGLLLPRSKDPHPSRLDLLGSVLSVATLMTLVYAVIEGPDLGWTSAGVIGAGLAGVVLLAGFVAWESRCDHPMLDLELFRDRRFSIGALTLVILYFSALGTYFLYTQHLQFVLGYSALRAGVYSVPFAVVLVMVSLQTPRALARFGTGRVAGVGLLALAAGTFLRAFATAGTGYPLLLVSLVIVAVGVGSTIAPSTNSIMSSLSAAQSGVGSAMNDAARQIGAAAGVAVLGSVWASSYRHSLAAAGARWERR